MLPAAVLNVYICRILAFRLLESIDIPEVWLHALLVYSGPIHNNMMEFVNVHSLKTVRTLTALCPICAINNLGRKAVK